MGPRPPLRLCPHSTLWCRVFQLAGRGLRPGSLQAPRTSAGRQGLFGESELLLPGEGWVWQPLAGLGVG